MDIAIAMNEGSTGPDGIGWMREAGFEAVRCVPLTASFSMITGTK
jgi:hypothetical protein